MMAGAVADVHGAWMTEQNARVLVTGLLKMASGMASQFLPMNSTVGLVRERDAWRVCDAPVA